MWTSWSIRPGVVPVPLPMKIICHVDDVVDNIGYVGNGESLEIPERCRSSDGQCRPGRQLRLECLEEAQISATIAWISWWDVRNIRSLCKRNSSASWSA